MPDQVGAPFDAVLAAAQAGAGWAAERIWISLAPKVAGYLRSQGASEPDDLTSEVFLGVFRSLGSFSGSEEQFRSWVFTIAHRRLVDERRGTGRRPAPAWGVEPDCGPPGPSAEHEALQRLSAERVRDLCDRLVPDQRDVLLLRLVGGLTVQDVAARSASRRGGPPMADKRAHPSPPLGAVPSSNTDRRARRDPPLSVPAFWRPGPPPPATLTR